MPGENMMTGKEDFAASLMDDMDPRLLDLIQTRVNSFIKWDLVRFFHDNPHTTDTADSIARYTGRDVRTVEPELIQLAQDGVLDMEDLSGMRVYTLTQDQDVRDLVEYRLHPPADGEDVEIPVLAQGWRAEVVGQTLDDVLSGEIAIRVRNPKSDNPLSLERVK